MLRAATLVAAAALSWVGVSGSPHNSAFRRRDAPQIPGYGFSGCYTEATASRALTGSAYFDDAMTIEKCASACTGFKYFGVEYGRECYCGNTINDGSVPAQLVDCSFPCPGDSTENCGAGNRLDLYTRSADPTPVTDQGYSSKGCYAEPPNGRALASIQTRAGDMTVEACAQFCGNAGYSFFGLEYYTECYCGHILMPGTEQAADTDCKYPCAGNPQEVCGGDWRLNVYQFGAASLPSTTTSANPSATASTGLTGYTNEGCYTEAQGIRALSDIAYYDDAMTVEKCAAAAAGYTWFGVEYGRECYGGNQINSAQGSVPTSLAECSFPCPGNPAENCGAGNRLNMYRVIDTVVSSSSAVEETTTTTAPDATTTSVEAVPTVEPPTTSADSTSSDAAEPTTTSADADATTSSDAAEATTTSAADATTSDAAEPTTSAADSTSSGAAEPTTTSADATTTSDAVEPTTTAAESTTSSDAAETTTSVADPTTTSNVVEPTTTSADATTTSDVVETTTSPVDSASTSDAVEPTTTSADVALTTVAAEPTSTSAAKATTTSVSTSSTSSPEAVPTTTSTTSDAAVPTTTSSSFTTAAPVEQTTSAAPTTTSTSAAAATTTTTTVATTAPADQTTLTTVTTSTTSAAAATTTSAAPAPPVSVLINGGFETSGGWSIVTPFSPSQGVSYSFVDTSAAHSGTHSGSVAWTATATPSTAWIKQVVTLQPDRQYNFSGWTRASTGSNSCSVTYTVTTADAAATLLKTVAAVNGVNPQWAQATGFYTTPAGAAAAQYALNVKVACTGSPAKKVYVDDLTFIEA